MILFWNYRILAILAVLARMAKIPSAELASVTRLSLNQWICGAPPYWMWGLMGLVFVGLHIALAWLSPDFSHDRDLTSKPILVLVGIELFVGVLYLLVVWSVRDAPRDKAWLVWVIAVGALLRVSLLGSTPMLEDDYYRYLWDGAVVAKRVNPYAFAPSQILENDEEAGSVPTLLRQLAADSGDVASRINHPRLRSIYPPIAQAAFALAHWLRPWSLVAWRLVLLGFDLVTLGLLILLLRRLKLPLLWLVAYWWNPLLVKETFNSGHMDVIILPFVLGAVLLTISDKHVWAAGSLGLAIGAKIWPVVLLPIVLRPVLTNPKRLLPALGLFSLLGCAMFLPIYAAGFDDSSGFVVYGQRWEMNDASFMAIVWVAQVFLKGIGIHPGHGYFVARVCVVVMLAVWIVWFARQKAGDAADVCERCLLIIAAMFLLSPTQFPWYYVWLVPFLAIRPRPSLLLLTVLLPLYYLRFYLDARGNKEFFDYGIVWLEYVPVWLLLVREWYMRRQRRSVVPVEVIA
jgi:hypothetical protein